MGSPPAKKLKKSIITWAAILLVISLVILGLLRLGVYYSSDILYQLVKNETNGFYQISYEEIDIDLWNKAIKLKKVTLKPDSSKEYPTNSLNNLYDLELSGLNIQLKSITSIYMKRQLVIENVRIIDPQIHVTRKDNVPDESFSLQTGNLYKEIAAYLRVLRIDLFKIDNGKFTHSPSELGLGNIDLFVRNILIDSASRPDQRFYSENIELEIHNQSFKLGDSIHQLSFDRFLLSTADSVLTFENLTLKPISETDRTLNKLDDKMIYDISIPELKLKGVDYFSAYRLNHLEMEELSLTDSYISLEEHSDSNVKKRSITDNSLLKQLINVFDEVKIGKMRFINTQLELKTNDDYNHNYQHVQTKRADIVLYNILLDSTNHQFDRSKKYFNDVDIIIKDYRSYLPDSIHTIQFDLLQLSSFDSTLRFENFNISNQGIINDADMYLSINLPMVHFKGLNYLDILLRKQLIIREMRLQNPDIVFESNSAYLGQMDYSPDSLYSIIADYFKVVGIKKLLLDQGSFSINKQLSFGQADFMISNFNIPGDSNSWYDVLDDMSFDIHDMVMHNEKIQLEADHLVVDSLRGKLVFDQLSIDYLDSSTTLSGNLSNLTITGIDIDHMSAGNHLAFDTISMINPQVDVVIYKPKSDRIINDFSVDKFIEIVNGKIHVKNYDSTEIEFNKFNTNLTMSANKNIQYGTAESISITSPILSHKLYISQLKISKEQILTINNIVVESLIDRPIQKIQMNGQLPGVTLYGLDQNMFWSDHKIVGDSLILKTPNLNLSINDVDKGMITSDSFGIQLQKVILDTGRLTISGIEKSAIHSMNMLEISATLEGFEFPQHAMSSADHLLFAEDLALHVKDFEIVTTIGDNLSISELTFHKIDGLLDFDSLRYDQANSTTSALLPNTKIIGLDLHAYLSNQRIILDSIQVTAPYVMLDINSLNVDSEHPIKALPAPIKFNYLSSKGIEFKFVDHLNKTNYSMHKGNIEIDEFSAKNEIHWNQFFGYAQQATISGENLVVPLGSDYQLSIDKYLLQHPKNMLSLDRINLSSNYSATAYSSQLAFQKDWFDVNVDDITVSGLDFKRFLEKKEFQTKKITVEGLDALVLRDKTVPFDSLAVKALPQSMLLNTNAWIYIDTVYVKGNIKHQLIPENNDELAEISFNRLDASLFNITTVDSMANKPMHLVSTGQLADTAHFEIRVVFDMQDPKDRFSLNGQIDQMQLGALNKLLRPLANINIKEGYAERINFNMKANKEVATGEMQFRYDDLKIQILNPETNDMSGLNQGIKTFFANTFVVKSKNPSFIILRPGVIFHERDSSRAIFHYWGEALLSGAVSSIGINKSKKEEKRYDKEIEEKER